MKKEKLIGATTIPYNDNCFIQVLNIKETAKTKYKLEEHCYVDFYNVFRRYKNIDGKEIVEDGVYFIDRIELCKNLGYQLIDGKLIIYSYDVVKERNYHAVNKIFKYYDVNEDITLNIGAKEIMDSLGFNLPDIEKNKIELVDIKSKKLDEYIKCLEDKIDLTKVIPLVNMCKKNKTYTDKQLYKEKMIYIIPRYEFAKYYTKLVTGASNNIKINTPIININDYQGRKKRKIKIKKKYDKDNL